MNELTKRRFLRAILMSPFLISIACSCTPALSQPLKLGMNLNGIAYYTISPFIDRMKTASPWEAVWRGAPPAVLPKLVDVNGNLISVPADAVQVQAALALDNTDGKPQLYELTFDGDLTAGLLSGSVVKSARGSIIFSYTGTGPYTLLRIYSMKKAPHFLRLARLDEAPLLSQGEIFRPSFLNKLKGFTTLRFMDWMITNGSPYAESYPGDNVFSYARGVPISVMLALCKKVGARGWFNIPHLATDGLINAMIKQLDDTGHHIIEPSNEVWNTGFVQGRYAVEQGKGDGPKWYGAFATRIAGAARGTGLRVVLGWQTVAPERASAVWNAVYAAGGKNADFGGWIIAAYVNGTMTRSDGPMLQMAKAHDVRAALDNIWHSTGRGAMSVDTMAKIFVAQGEVAKAHQVPLLAYEANFHLNMLPDFDAEKKLVVPFVGAIQKDPYAAEVMRANLDAFQAAGGEEAVLFNLDSPLSEWGYFSFDGTGSWSEVQRRIFLASTAKDPASGH